MSRRFSIGAALLAAVLLTVACAKPAPPPPSSLLIADFNSGAPPSNLGGPFGIFLANEDRREQGCVMNFTTAHRYGSEGYGLELQYDVEDTVPAFSGFWVKLQNLDARPYSAVRLRLKGEPGRCTSRLKVDLKNPWEQGSVTLEEISDEYREYTIPFAQFSGLKDFSCLTEFVLVFDDRTSDPKTGILYVDDISLVPR